MESADTYAARAMGAMPETAQMYATLAVAAATLEAAATTTEPVPLTYSQRQAAIDVGQAHQSLANALHDHPQNLVEVLSRASHDAYEAAAAEHGWSTQEASRVPWAEVPDANKAVVRASVRAVMDTLRSAFNIR